MSRSIKHTESEFMSENPSHTNSTQAEVFDLERARFEWEQRRFRLILYSLVAGLITILYVCGFLLYSRSRNIDYIDDRIVRLERDVEKIDEKLDEFNRQYYRTIDDTERVRSDASTLLNEVKRLSEELQAMRDSLEVDAATGGGSDE